MVKAAHKAPSGSGRRVGRPAMIEPFDMPRGEDRLVQVEAVLQAAEKSGLTTDKTGRIGGRVSPKLVQQAKRRTGLKTDSDLINFALANVALEDAFAMAFHEAAGAVDPGLDLGF